MITIGGLLLALACVVAASAGGPETLAVGLFLVGLGWSCTMVAGSTLLTESVPAAVPPAAQGLNDLVMGLAGAVAGAVSGVVVAWAGYPALVLGSALIAVPLVVVAGRQGRRRVRPTRKGDDVRRTDFWSRMEQVFGSGYAYSVAADQVLPQLGRTVDQAFAEGEDTAVVWRAVVAAYGDRVPPKLR